MHPILLKLGPLSVYSYGVMVALGFALATACIYMRAPKFGFNRDNVVDLMIIILVSGILGARLFYVLQNVNYYLANPCEMPNLSKGGLVWYGAFISGLAASAVYIRKKRLPYLDVMDLVVPYVALAQSVGRIGCFLNGCCYGIEASLNCPLAACSGADPVMRYPTQLYSAALLLLIFIALRIWQDHRRFSGEIFFGYCMLYSTKRLFVEFLRGDNPRVFSGLTLSQLISCVVLMLSLGAFISLAAIWKKKL